MKEYAIKVCPRCGEELFADMHVCYGCLYEFPPAGDAASAASPSTPRDDGPTSDTEALALPGLVEDEPFLWDAGLPPAESCWEDDTLDLSGVSRAAIASPTPSQEAHSSSREVLCWVRTPSMEVRLPIPNEGLVIGRAPVGTGRQAAAQFLKGQHAAETGRDADGRSAAHHHHLQGPDGLVQGADGQVVLAPGQGALVQQIQGHGVSVETDMVFHAVLDG